MKMPPNGYLSSVALLTMLGVTTHAGAQSRRIVEDPKLFKIHLTDVNTGVYAEGISETTSFGGNSGTITHDRYFIGPTLGFGAYGSVYHPYLFQYRLNNEGAFGYAVEQINTPTRQYSRTEWQYLGRFSGSADILSSKPYNGNLFSDYEHSYRDYDFFTRVDVDSLRYGARFRYERGPFSMNTSYTRRDEEISGLTRPSISHDDLVNVNARLEHGKGATVLNYNFTQNQRRDFGLSTEVTDHTVSLADNEQFGSRDQFRLNSRGSYSHREGFGEKSDLVSGGTQLEGQYRENLSSYTSLDYDRYKNLGFTADTMVGHGELRHQLYESLTSRLILQGSNQEISDEGGSGYTRRFGGGFAEAYSKRLGPLHRLRVENSVLLEHVDQAAVQTVENERHSFGELGAGSESFILRQPKVLLFTIEVFDASKIQQWVEGFDYEVTLNGFQTIISRRPGTSRIPAGASVVVDYEVEPPPPGNYEALSDSFTIRLDLWDNFWGIYSRVNLFLNNGPGELRVPDLKSYTFGTDLTWKWLRAGAEYQIYDSDQSEFTAARLFQSANFRPDESSSLSFVLSESLINYEEANRQEQNYRFITHYRHTFTHRFSLDVEGGIDVRRGPGVDQTLAAFRPGLQYRYGNFSVRAGYDFEYSLFLEREERVKHRFFVRAQRSF